MHQIMEGSQLDDSQQAPDPLQRLAERVEADAETTAQLLSFTRTLRRSINEKRVRSGMAPIDADEVGADENVRSPPRNDRLFPESYAEVPVKASPGNGYKSLHLIGANYAQQSSLNTTSSRAPPAVHLKVGANNEYELFVDNPQPAPVLQAAGTMLDVSQAVSSPAKFMAAAPPTLNPVIRQYSAERREDAGARGGSRRHAYTRLQRSRRRYGDRRVGRERRRRSRSRSEDSWEDSDSSRAWGRGDEPASGSDSCSASGTGGLRPRGRTSTSLRRRRVRGGRRSRAREESQDDYDDYKDDSSVSTEGNKEMIKTLLRSYFSRGRTRTSTTNTKRDKTKAKAKAKAKAKRARERVKVKAAARKEEAAAKDAAHGHSDDESSDDKTDTDGDEKRSLWSIVRAYTKKSPEAIAKAERDKAKAKAKAKAKRARERVRKRAKRRQVRRDKLSLVDIEGRAAGGHHSNDESSDDESSDDETESDGNGSSSEERAVSKPASSWSTLRALLIGRGASLQSHRAQLQKKRRQERLLAESSGDDESESQDSGSSSGDNDGGVDTLWSRLIDFKRRRPDEQLRAAEEGRGDERGFWPLLASYQRRRRGERRRDPGRPLPSLEAVEAQATKEEKRDERSFWSMLRTFRKQRKAERRVVKAHLNRPENKKRMEKRKEKRKGSSRWGGFSLLPRMAGGLRPPRTRAARWRGVGELFADMERRRGSRAQRAGGVKASASRSYSVKGSGRGRGQLRELFSSLPRSPQDRGFSQPARGSEPGGGGEPLAAHTKLRYRLGLAQLPEAEEVEQQRPTPAFDLGIVPYIRSRYALLARYALLESRSGDALSRLPAGSQLQQAGGAGTAAPHVQSRYRLAQGGASAGRAREVHSPRSRRMDARSALQAPPHRSPHRSPQTSPAKPSLIKQDIASKESAAKYYASYRDGRFDDSDLMVVGPLHTPILVSSREAGRADSSGISEGLSAGLAETLWTTTRAPSPQSSTVRSDESYSLGSPEEVSQLSPPVGRSDEGGGLGEELPQQLDIAALAERARRAADGPPHKEFRYWVTEYQRRAQGLAPFDCVDVIIGDLGHGGGARAADIL